MLKQLLLVLSIDAIVNGKDEDDLQTEIMCPEGWYADDLITYSIDTNNAIVPTCLICRRNSYFNYPFKYVEICIVRAFHNNLKSVQLSKVSINETSQNYDMPFCGAKLNTISNSDFHLKNLVPCPMNYAMTTFMKPHVDLICPISYELFSVQKRQFYQLSEAKSNSEVVKTNCSVCKKNNEVNKSITLATVTLCPYDHNLWFDKKVYSTVMNRLRECSKDCNAQSIPKINPDLHCGSAFSSISDDPKQNNVPNHILCSQVSICKSYT